MGTMYKNILDTQNLIDPKTVLKVVNGVKITPQLLMLHYPGLKGLVKCDVDEKGMLYVPHKSNNTKNQDNKNNKARKLNPDYVVCVFTKHSRGVCYSFKLFNKTFV